MKVKDLIKELKKYNENELVAAVVDHPHTGKSEMEVESVSRNNYILGAVYDFGDETRLTRVLINLGSRVQ